MQSHSKNHRFVVCFTIFMAFECVRSKIFNRCELARELRDVHEIPVQQLAVWVCIARYESEYNTSARNPGSGDHGLFQISQQFWCSPPGFACGVNCAQLRDDDIEDDVICARRIYNEHKRLSGNGFNAWVVYPQYCRQKNYAETFLNGCFPEGLVRNIDEETQTKPLPTVDYFPQFAKRTKSTTLPTTTTTTTRKSTLHPSVTRKTILNKSGKFSSTTTRIHQTSITTSTLSPPTSTPDQHASSGVVAVEKLGEKQKFMFTLSRTGFKFSRL